MYKKLKNVYFVLLTVVATVGVMTTTSNSQSLYSSYNFNGDTIVIDGNTPVTQKIKDKVSIYLDEKNRKERETLKWNNRMKDVFFHDFISRSSSSY